MSAEPVYRYEPLSHADFLTMPDTIYVLRFSARRVLFLWERNYIRGGRISACISNRIPVNYYRFLRRDVSRVNDILTGLNLHPNASQGQRWTRLMEALGEEADEEGESPTESPGITVHQNPQNGVRIVHSQSKAKKPPSGSPLTVKEIVAELRIGPKKARELITRGHITGTHHPKPIGFRADADSVERISRIFARRRLVRTEWTRVPEGEECRIIWAELLKAIEEAEE